VSRYRSEFIAVSEVKVNGRQVSKFLIQVLWDVALFQLDKCGFLQWNIDYIFRIDLWKNNGTLFTKIGNLFVLSNLNYLFPDSIKLFLVSLFIMVISTLIRWNTSYISDFVELLVFMLILNFILYSEKNFRSDFVLERPSIFGSFCRSYALLFSPWRIS